MSGAVKLMPPDKAVGGSHYTSQSFEEAHTVVTGKGVLYGITIVNKNASQIYMWVFDNTASSGTRLTVPFPVPSGGIVSGSDLFGKPFSNGLRVAASSTLGTFTALGANDISMEVDWVVMP